MNIIRRLFKINKLGSNDHSLRAPTRSIFYIKAFLASFLQGAAQEKYKGRAGRNSRRMDEGREAVILTC